MWQMNGVLAEQGRSLFGERTRAGVKAAKKRSEIRPQAEIEPGRD
jgi:hypothetical protein